MMFWLILFVAYLFVTYNSLLKSVSPIQPCNPRYPNCFKPVIVVGDILDLELWLYTAAIKTTTHDENNETETEIKPRQQQQKQNQFHWEPIKSCHFNFTIPKSGSLPVDLTGSSSSSDSQNITKECEIPIPDFARVRSTNKNDPKPLKGRFLFRRAKDGKVVSTVSFELTRIIERRPGGLFWSTGTNDKTPGSTHRSLLEDPPDSKKSSSKNNKNDDGPEWVPHLKYGKSPIRIRFVAEDRGYSFLQRADGLTLETWNRTAYAPTIYVDDLSLQQSSRLELAPPEDNKPPVKLHIKFSSVTPIVDGLIRQSSEAFKSIETIMPGEELDEIRYFLQDERLYRFLLTQIISYLHMWFDYLAFRDEIRFYRGRKNLTGVSTSTSITRMASSIIIFLYLLDGGGTSWVVLLSLFSSCLVDSWKVWKLLRPTISTKFPFLAIRKFETAKEQETSHYDTIAAANLAMVLYPLVVGWAIYALQHYKYKSWYSWLISNLANCVYTFGFISLCPQLYVNYRLKSVAHLPWKVFLYKMFNTFVDDAFAWIIEMPWKHRIMTLRDDVVFLLFLVQVYIYRVDKTRTNEFGYSYQEEADDNEEEEKEKEPTDLLVGGKAKIE